MRWRGERQSDNVEDRRGMSVSRGVKVGSIGGLGLVAVVVISMFLGVDPTALLQVVGQSTQSSSVSTEQTTSPPPMMTCAILLPSCWPKPKMCGTKHFSKPDGHMKSPSWCCFPVLSNRPVTWLMKLLCIGVILLVAVLMIAACGKAEKSAALLHVKSNFADIVNLTVFDNRLWFAASLDFFQRIFLQYR